jgi:hypothetical protein
MGKKRGGSTDSSWMVKAKRIITKRRWSSRKVKRNEEERDYPGIGIHRPAVIGSRAALPLSLIRIYYSNQMF